MLIKKPKKLFVSFTAMEDFWKCPRLYYWKRVKKLERVIFHLPFFIGRLMGPGIHMLYKLPKNAVKEFDREYKNEVRKTRKWVSLSTEDEQAIEYARISGKAMLEAYRTRYRKLIKATKIIRNEAPFHYNGIKGVTVIGKLDNVMHVHNKRFVHELKTTQILTNDYVRGIQTRYQPALYKYLVNRTKDAIKLIGGKLRGAIFDVIKKPGIRQRQGETKQGFIARLKEWYEDGSETKFHMERSEQLLLKEDDVMNTLEKTVNQLKENKFELDMYYQDFSWCHPAKGFPCEMYDICHKGGPDTPENKVQFKKRQSYKVGKT